MIEERAQVIEINGDTLILQAKRQSACGSCAANKGCGTSVLSKVVGQKFTRFQASNNINAKVGDSVIVAIPEDALVKGSLVMYLVPVLGMLVAGLLADFYLEASLPFRDFIVAVTSMSGLACGALFARKYFISSASTNLYTPVVLRKIFD